MEEFKRQLELEYSPGTSPAAGGEQTQTYTDPSDGTVYEWDNEKRAWFPKIDAEFLATYHSSYGFYQETPSEESSANIATAPADDIKDLKDEIKEPEAKKEKLTSEPSWFDIDDNRNTNVYVSGLPLDITINEFTELMTKCGLIMENDEGEPKIKLYRDFNGDVKGDGLCCYLKVESVQLAIQLLDDTELRGHKISVNKAKFEMKGEYNPLLKKKKQRKKKQKFNKQEKLLDWKEKKVTIAKPKHKKVVIFKHVFDPKEFDDDPGLIVDIKNDMMEECSKLGEVKKIILFDRHVDGVVSVAFKDFEAAELTIQTMNGRYYGGSQLEVFEWDGVTNYQVEETEGEREQRLRQWESYISQENKDSDTKHLNTEAETDTSRETKPLPTSLDKPN
jgi:RNA recognition motif-containing protein